MCRRPGLALDGWIDVLAETIRVEARARLDTDLARASRLVLQRDISLTGSATADVEVRGEIADPTVNIKLLGPMVRLGTAPSINIAADATYAAGRIDVDSLSVTSDAGAIDVNGTLAVTAAGAARESRLVGRIVNLDVDRLLEASGVRGPVAIGTTAAGQIDVTLDAAVPLDADAWRHASVNGSVALTPTGSGLSIGGRLDPAMRGGRWALGHALRAQAGRTSIDGTLSGNLQQLDDPTTHSLSGSTRVRIEEVRTLIPILQQAGCERAVATRPGRRHRRTADRPSRHHCGARLERDDQRPRHSRAWHRRRRRTRLDGGDRSKGAQYRVA